MAKDKNSSDLGPPTGPITQAAPATPPEPASSPESANTPASSGLKTFLVLLPKHKSLMTDPKDPGKKILVDKLPIVAETPGDAIQKFNELNGIRSTIHKHVVELAPVAD